VFTARYALSPYIKQIRFVFKRLMYSTFLLFVPKTDYKKLTCKNLYLMDPEKINYDLIETVITWIVAGVHGFPARGSILVCTCSYFEKSLYILFLF
jgi:hypothetical protein